MLITLYFLLAFAATIVGSITGMGGGIIMKPVLDSLGNFSAATINVLASATVFCMTLVAIANNLISKQKIDMRLAVQIGLGSVIGGNIGYFMLSHIIVGAVNSKVLLIQNFILAILLIAVFIYMLNKTKIAPLGLTGVAPTFLTGFVLGAVSSFLSIGGGPINVALLIFVFAMNTKSAALYSLTTIFFVQSAKLILLAIGGGFSEYNLSMLAPLIIGAVSGGYIGSALGKKLSENTVEYAFYAVQLFVFSICVSNIIQNID